MTDHRCAQHGLAGCRRAHQTIPYVRPARYDQAAQFGDWHEARSVEEARRRMYRDLTILQWSLLALAVIVLVMLIVTVSMLAGSSAAESYGPLLPPAAPSPTPYPQGWTP